MYREQWVRHACHSTVSRDPSARVPHAFNSTQKGWRLLFRPWTLVAPATTHSGLMTPATTTRARTAPVIASMVADLFRPRPTRPTRSIMAHIFYSLSNATTNMVTRPAPHRTRLNMPLRPPLFSSTALCSTPTLARGTMLHTCWPAVNQRHQRRHRRQQCTTQATFYYFRTNRFRISLLSCRTSSAPSGDTSPPLKRHRRYLLLPHCLLLRSSARRHSPRSLSLPHRPLVQALHRAISSRQSR